MMLTVMNSINLEATDPNVEIIARMPYIKELVKNKANIYASTIELKDRFQDVHIQYSTESLFFDSENGDNLMYIYELRQPIKKNYRTVAMKFQPSNYLSEQQCKRRCTTNVVYTPVLGDR